MRIAVSVIVQKVFSANGTIDVLFKTFSGRVMLSVICYSHEQQNDLSTRLRGPSPSCFLALSRVPTAYASLKADESHEDTGYVGARKTLN